MRRPPVSNSIGATGRCALLLVSSLLVSALGCTNLDENPTSSITPGNFYRNESEVLGALAGVYAMVRNTLPGYGDFYNLTEISTDEMVVPTRGQDWYDNGRWLEIHHQLWAANSPSGLGDINGVWVTGFGGIARANVLLDALQHVSVPNQATIVAETRALRAFFYYLLMDTFGGVPIVTTPDIAKRARNTRAEVFQFIEKELQAARDSGLPATWPAESNGRFTKGAADAILANMYLNAGVFTKDAGISTAGYNSCQGVQVSGGADACTAAIAAADRLLNSGVYQLADTFVKSFRADNDLSPENIFVVKFLAQDGLGFRLLMTTLHYNQFTPSPWNGFATLAETYNAFDAVDQRRKIFLIGPQVNLETGAPALDRNKQPLVFTDTIKDVTQATEGEGPRIYKWPYDPKHVGPDNGNDFAFFRLGEIYLIKAEVQNQLGQTPAALTLVNALRARDFNPPKPLDITVSQDSARALILSERLFELTFEAKRRQDLIRYGRYTLAWGFKPAGSPNLVLMPIPQTQIDANPLLKQNPGY